MVSSKDIPTMDVNYVSMVSTQLVQKKWKCSPSVIRDELAVVQVMAESNAALLKRTRCKIVHALTLLHDYATSIEFVQD